MSKYEQNMIIDDKIETKAKRNKCYQNKRTTVKKEKICNQS